MDYYYYNTNNTECIIDVQNLQGYKYPQILFIKNSNNLEKLSLYGMNRIKVAIKNCPKLLSIDNNNPHKESRYMFSLYLGNGLNRLESVNVNRIKSVIFRTGKLMNFKRLIIKEIDSMRLNINFTNYPNLEVLKLSKCTLDNIYIFKNLVNLELHKCHVKDIILFGGLNLKSLSIEYTTFKSLDVKAYLDGIEYLNLQLEDKTFPYLPLPQNPKKDFKINLDYYTVYEYELKIYLIENNIIPYVNNTKCNNLNKLLFRKP